jgi:carboxymethylenebutenolidase
MSGQWISIAAADGNASRAYLAIPEARHGPGLVLLDETTALEIADHYAVEGYVVLCPEQLGSDISATIAALRARPECSGKVGVLGFGRGGGIAYLAAAEGGVDGAVVYYGAGITEALDPAPRIACPVVMHFAEKDLDVPPEAVARIKEAFLVV